MTRPTVPAPAPGDLRDALAGGIADVLLDGGSFSPRAFADRLLAGPLKPYLAAEATIADLTAERDAALESARGLYDDRTRECETASRYWNEARRLDANLLDLARMYGEACADLVRLHMALDYDDIAWGMYTARRDRERIEALTVERDAAVAEIEDWKRRYGLSTGRALDAIAGRDAAEAQTQALQARVGGLEKENDHLRASLANGGGPCAYCNLPREDWAKCASGFPGCARGDDAMLCPNVGAWLEYGERLTSSAAVEAACDAFFSDPAMPWERAIEKGPELAAEVRIRMRASLSAALDAQPTEPVEERTDANP